MLISQELQISNRSLIVASWSSFMLSYVEEAKFKVFDILIRSTRIKFMFSWAWKKFYEFRPSLHLFTFFLFNYFVVTGIIRFYCVFHFFFLEQRKFVSVIVGTTIFLSPCVQFNTNRLSITSRQAIYYLDIFSCHEQPFYSLLFCLSSGRNNIIPKVKSALICFCDIC